MKSDELPPATGRSKPAKRYDPDLTEEQVTTISYEIVSTLRDQCHAFFSAFTSYAHEDRAFARALHDDPRFLVFEEPHKRCPYPGRVRA